MITSNPITVEQVDRDAAAIYLGPFDRFAAEDIWAGGLDDHSLVQAFAKHRIAAAEAATEAEGERILSVIAEMMNCHVENWPSLRKVETAIVLVDKTLAAALARPDLSQTIQAMRAAMEAHPFWRKVVGTPAENDLPVIAAEIAIRRGGRDA